MEGGRPTRGRRKKRSWKRRKEPSGSFFSLPISLKREARQEGCRAGSLAKEKEREGQINELEIPGWLCPSLPLFPRKAVAELPFFLRLKPQLQGGGGTKKERGEGLWRRDELGLLSFSISSYLPPSLLLLLVSAHLISPRRVGFLLLLLSPLRTLPSSL